LVTTRGGLFIRARTDQTEEGLPRYVKRDSPRRPLDQPQHLFNSDKAREFHAYLASKKTAPVRARFQGPDGGFVALLTLLMLRCNFTSHFSINRQVRRNAKGWGLVGSVATDPRPPEYPRESVAGVAAFHHRGGPFCGRAYSSVKPPQILAAQIGDSLYWDFSLTTFAPVA
jgi:hypothetical protein